MIQDSIIKIKIPIYVQKVVRMLSKEGYQVHLVGGSLRDVVLDIEPEDWDLATEAKPEEMLQIFPKSVSTGARFGMVSALISGKGGEIFEVQVTTFRSEEKYIDGRWPSEVTFINDIDLDLGRRDFTFNAMSLDLGNADCDDCDEYQELPLHDPFNGLRDLGLRVVRAVGTPLERFKEDGLRGFRACRLASQLDFDIEEETFIAIKEALPVSKQVSMERIREEFMKLLIHSPKPSKGIDLLRKTGLLEIFLPELLEGIGVEQKMFHANDVYWHSLKSCDVAPDSIKLSALLHDIGKPRKSTGDGHFYGHDKESAEMSKIIMKRMKFSNAEIERVYRLVINHMFCYPYVSDDMDDITIQNVQEHEWTDAAVRRFIARVGEENLDELFQLRIADASSNPKASFSPEEIRYLQDRISEVRSDDMALKVTDLVINGDDLIEIGIPRGPVIRNVLENLLQKVLDDPILNNKEKLLKEAKEFYSKYEKK